MCKNEQTSKRSINLFFSIHSNTHLNNRFQFVFFLFFLFEILIAIEIITIITSITRSWRDKWMLSMKSSRSEPISTEVWIEFKSLSLATLNLIFFSSILFQNSWGVFLYSFTLNLISLFFFWQNDQIKRKKRTVQINSKIKSNQIKN